MSRNRHAERFLLARASLYLAGAASAVFGVAGWYSAALTPASIVLMGFTALSALVIPVTFEVVGRDRWSFLVLPAALVFGLANGYSFHHGVDHLVEDPRRLAYTAAEIAPKQAVLNAASAAVAAHVAPVFPDSMGPKNIAARMDGWRLVHQPLVDAETKASADLIAAKAGYTPFIADPIVWGVSGALDLALAFALAGITLVRQSIEARARKTRDAEKVAKAKAAEKAARKAVTPKRPRNQNEAERAARFLPDLPVGYFDRPRLVVSNA